MSKEITIDTKVVEVIADKKNMYLLKYLDKYEYRYDALLKRIKAGRLSTRDCCTKARIPEATFYKILEIYDGIMKYCDDNDIDWERTNYYNFLEKVGIIKDAYIDGTDERLKRIEKMGEDLVEDGKLVRKGDIKADQFILSYARRNEFKKEQDEVALNKSTGINIVFNFSADEFKNASVISQENLEKFKLNKK